jgi:hypothetical protein
VVEDCSALTSLTEVDLSNNAFEDKESLLPLFKAPKLSSLDLRGCPCESIENFRRWIIAHNANLKMLDGKEVSALERRYAYNLFPELKTVAAVPASKPVPVAFSDDIFHESVSQLFEQSPAKKKEPVDTFFAVSDAPAATDMGAFFAVTPVGQTAAYKEPIKAESPTKKKSEAIEPKKGGLLFDNDILSRHGRDQNADEDVLSGVLDAKKRPTGRTTPVAKAESPPKVVLASMDDVLNNNVVSGKSFLDETTKPNANKKPSVPLQRSGGSSAEKKEVVDYSSMFATLGSPNPADGEKKKDEEGGINVKIFDEEAKPAATVPLAKVEFAGPKIVKEVPKDASPPKKGSVVETFKAEEELGENVSYEVEQICAYVMRAFRPGPNVASNNGLFEFSVLHNQMSPDTFYVRVSSQTGVSVHAGHVPSVEKWAIDCKISLTDSVMHNLLNGGTDPLSALLSGSMNVVGEVQKLLMFRDSFRFALSRFNLYQKQWNDCVREEEEELAELARGKVLENDFSRALEFFLSVWKGQVPEYWTKEGYMLISQLPDNLFYKGYKAKQSYFPPKVVLKLSKDYVEIIPFDEKVLEDKTVFCEIYGKKSIIRSVLNGSMSLRNTLDLLANTGQTQYRYGTSSYVVDANSQDMPPFLFVRNFSSTVNDFEQIMRCFDINVLAYDRFLAEKKKDSVPSSVPVSVGAATSATTPDGPGSPLMKATSPKEWVEKLKTVKDDITKRLNTNNNSSTSPQKQPFDMDDMFFGSSPSKVGGTSSGSSSSSSKAPIDSIFGPVGGDVKEMTAVSSSSSKNVPVEKGFTPKASFQDYEI